MCSDVFIPEIVAYSGKPALYVSDTHIKKSFGRAYIVCLGISVEHSITLVRYRENPELFNMSVRNVQSRLATVCDYLGYKYIGTHSFRKYAATRLYKLSGNDVEMVRRFLQHSSASVTYHYISQTPPFMEKCLKKMGNVIATF